MTIPSDIGPIGGLPPEQVVRAAGLVREGRMVSLAAVRFPGMPLFPGHPPFQVLNYRTPRGIRVTGAQPWGPINDAGLGYMAEYVMATSHSGAHMDALAHMTVDDDMHWYGGGNADEHLTDFGPIHGDASKMPPFFTRGVLLDVPGLPRRGLPAQGLADRRRRDGRDLRRPGRHGPALGRGRHPDRLHGPLARRREDGGPQDAGTRHLRGPLAPGARRRRDRHRHRDLRGPAGPRPGADRQPAARPHRRSSSRTASTSWRASTSRSWRASASTSSSSSPCP